MTSPRSVCQSSINPRAPIPHRLSPTVQQWSIPDSFALRKHVEGSTDRPPEFTVQVPRIAIARAASWRWVAALGFLRAKTSSLTCTRHNLSSQNSSWRNSLRNEGALGRKLGRRGCALLAAGSAHPGWRWLCAQIRSRFCAVIHFGAWTCAGRPQLPGTEKTPGTNTAHSEPQTPPCANVNTPPTLQSVHVFNTT